MSSFNTFTFIFIFLPAAVILDRLPVFRKTIRRRNALLLILSLLFYLAAAPAFFPLLVVSVLVTFVLGKIIAGTSSETVRTAAFTAGIMINAGLLLFYKFAGVLPLPASLLRLTQADGTLPLGLSYYSFQAISFLADVFKARRGEGDSDQMLSAGDGIRPDIRLGETALYIIAFPRLIAGPIASYHENIREIRSRGGSVDDLTAGLRRFAAGLGKKVLLADSLSLLTASCFKAADTTVATAWLGAISFALQLYFDFSGFSDMAIGIGRIFGFHYPENFDEPFRARSVTEFWRRWHISLMRWFRDYIYIPLGGNRVRAGRHIFNLFAVWLVAGIWHGSEGHFLVWAMFCFVLQLLEKYTLLGKISSVRVVGHLYGFLTFVTGIVMFHASSIRAGLTYWSHMFGIGVTGAVNAGTGQLLVSYLPLLVISGFLAAPSERMIREKTARARGRRAEGVRLALNLVIVMIFVVSACVIAIGSYQPAIYAGF